MFYKLNFKENTGFNHVLRKVAQFLLWGKLTCLVTAKCVIFPILLVR